MNVLAQLLGTGILIANILTRVSPLGSGVPASGNAFVISAAQQVILTGTIHSSMLSLTLKVFVAFGLGTIIQGWKKPGFFLKKPSPVGFFGFFWVFLCFLGFLGFFGFFWVFLPRREGSSGFFSFTNTFRCIQTLNYNHSY